VVNKFLRGCARLLPGISAVALFRLSIAAKLYAIFALLATVTIAIAVMAVLSARSHSGLTADFRASFDGARQLERVNALVYATISESRALIHAADPAAARLIAARLIANNDRLGDAVTELQWEVKADEQAAFETFAQRIKDFQESRRDLARRGIGADLTAAQEEAQSEAARAALSREIEQMSQLYSQRSKQLYGAIDRGVHDSAWLLAGLAVLLLMLAITGTFVVWHSCIRPLARVTKVTEQVADGQLDMEVPYRGRRDEIGALACSIAIFQAAMRHNEELNKTVRGDADERSRRQDEIATQISQFSADIELTLRDLVQLSEQMRSGSNQIANAVESTLDRTMRATGASTEANANVRDIASAADELAMSVLEIERQVAQSNDIAIKAVNEAEATNDTVQALSEAAGRIGDVIRLINDIAEQTNLLALNATIEAARAGEAGRGFAVVAGEVKALAGQTAQATEDIGQQIAGMQQATERSIAAISAIKRTIRDIGEISGAIAAAVTEQGAATQEIARSVETASRKSAETAEQIQRVNEATEATRTNSTTARVVADHLGEVASRIRGQVDRFFEGLRAA
jgi:methyl-accepting chemotaxis protein